MDTPIVRLFGLVVALFALLVVFTSRWTVFEANSLRSNGANKRPLLEEQRVHRGLVRAFDKTVLARSVKGRGGIYHRIYPTNGLFAQTVGYSFIGPGQTGIEQYRSGELSGERGEFATAAERLLGKKQVGNDVITALNPHAQQVATTALAGRIGSVVAIEPRTGRVLVMVSSPNYSPNILANQRGLDAINNLPGSPLLNRATQAGYPPGSTFKVVTATAALDTGQFTPQSYLNGKSGQIVATKPLKNFNSEDFGDIDLVTALTHSVNTVWAQVAIKLGVDVMAEYMRRFGFYRKPQLDYPDSEMIASGEYSRRTGKMLDPSSPTIDVGRMGIGQDKLRVTPLQMALVAAAIANGGRLMKPHLVDRITDPDGRTVKYIKPEVQAQVMHQKTARILGQMMSRVVQEGSGTAAALRGVEVAGKTGTAEVDPSQNITQPWFIAFAPVSNPRVAVAVTVERSPGGQGGEVAAPIAKQVMEALLQ